MSDEITEKQLRYLEFLIEDTQATDELGVSTGFFGPSIDEAVRIAKKKARNLTRKEAGRIIAKLKQIREFRVGEEEEWARLAEKQK